MNNSQIQNLRNQAIAQITEAKSSKELEEIRLKYLGRKGEINQLMQKIPSLKPEELAAFGKLVNEAKKTIEEAISHQPSAISHQPETNASWFDISQPGEMPKLGRKHPIIQTIDEITKIFERIGFSRVRYPEITTDWYCFEGVNVPPDHPSRDEQETFFVENSLVLSTHTTSGILQEIERVKKPPIRMLHIAKCYRRQVDIMHTPMFHQFEGWLVDKNVHVGHLKWVLDYFAKRFFGSQRVTRLRPHHFRYTEPSFEVDVTCSVCQGKGCRSCKEGWVELGGAGMAHPQVLINAGLNPKIYSALAFGWGVERVFTMRADLDDSRLLYQNDLRFLSQF